MAQIAEKLAKMADSSSDYVYLQIVDAKKLINMRVNLFAKISEVGLSRRSKGTDYFLALKIVDLSSPTQALSVNFFAEKKISLPNVKSAGDVICLHQVLMKIHNGDVYFLFNKRFSSFALFDGKMGMGLDPYQTSTNYHATDYDNALLVKLRTLSLELSEDAGTNTSISLLQNIAMGNVTDLICKILHVCETSEGEWMLFTWDGTDVPPISFQANLDAEKVEPCPLYPEISPLPREVLCSFPCVGTVMRVTIGKFYEDIQHLQAGDDWIKLCNVACEIQSEIWRGVMNSASRIFILSDEGSNAKYRKRFYDQRLTSNVGRQPLMCLEPSHITDTDYKNVPCATLMDSITNPQVLHRCKCVVRVVASCPWRGEDLRSPTGYYRVRLTLEDPTARIRAYIFGEDGVKFFGGGDVGADELTKKMKKLLGMKEAKEKGTEPAFRNPPWITCCLISYYLDETDRWGSRRHRIFATRLLD